MKRRSFEGFVVSDEIWRQCSNWMEVKWHLTGVSFYSTTNPYCLSGFCRNKCAGRSRDIDDSICIERGGLVDTALLVNIFDHLLLHWNSPSTVLGVWIRRGHVPRYWAGCVWNYWANYHLCKSRDWQQNYHLWLGRSNSLTSIYKSLHPRLQEPQVFAGATNQQGRQTREEFAAIS